MQDLNALKGKPIAQLREIAKALGIGNVMVKKRELIELIAGHAQGAAPSGDGAPAAQPGAEKPRRGRRPRVAQPEKNTETPAGGLFDQPAEEPAPAPSAPSSEVSEPAVQPAPKRRGRKPKNQNPEPAPVSYTHLRAHET